MYMNNNDGTSIEVPDRKKLSKEIIDYWEERVKECENPILTIRYADLVIDFSKKVRNTNPDIFLYREVIDNTILVCDRLIAIGLDLKVKSLRALSHAIQINDRERIVNISRAIINLESNIAEDSKAGLWGFSLRYLVINNYKKVSLELKTINELVQYRE